MPCELAMRALTLSLFLLIGQYFGDQVKNQFGIYFALDYMNTPAIKVEATSFSI